MRDGWRFWFPIALAIGLPACAPRTPRTPSIDQLLSGPRPAVNYSCQSVLRLRVRLESTSASVTVDGDGPYTLPQVSGRTDYSVFSDGTRVLEVYRGRVSFGVGRGALQACTS